MNTATKKMTRKPEKNLVAYVLELEKKIAEQKKELSAQVKDLEKERKRLIEEKARVEGILSSIGDGLVVVNEDKKIILINHTAEILTGWNSQDVSGRDWSDVILLATENGEPVAENDRPLALGLHQRVPTADAALYRYTRKDRTTFTVAITVSPVKIENKTTGAVLVFRDMTHEREIDKTKTEFVSLASHQLRTPISAMSWYTEMLLAGDSGPLNEQQRRFLDEIYAGSRRMADLVNALLNVSRLEMGTFIIEPEPTDIVAVLRIAIKEQRPQLEAKKIQLHEKYATNFPLVSADPKLLLMVLQNILSNAIKYTPNGGSIETEIIVSNTQDRESHFLIRISDTGYGIPEKQQHKIFTKLFRADNVREKDTDGTGLGLYIVKSIVDLLGGEIWFESEEEKGTTFYIAFPISQ